MAETGVLFVDDEPNVLQGIRRMLRHKRGEWTLHFAAGGREALDLMAQHRIDVVVTDMRMPEMDGAALLGAVQNSHPDTVRFVLSGQCDEETALRAVGVSHQYLSKPCEADELERKIGRAIQQRRLLHPEPLRRLMSGLGSMPTRPSVYADLVDELAKPQVSAERIDRIVEREPGLAARFLQICNSSYFGVGSTVRSVHQAVQFLGFDTLKALALGFGIIGQLTRRTVGGRDVDAVVRHCLEVGSLARSIARSADLGQDAMDEAYMAGLMHDIGILVLAENLGDAYEAVLQERDRAGLDLSAAEAAAFGADHAAVAGYLLGNWGLPAAIVEAVAAHHGGCCRPDAPIDALLAVHVAEMLIEEAELLAPGDRILGGRLSDAVRANAAVSELLPQWCSVAAALCSGRST